MDSLIETKKILVLKLSEKEAMLLYDALINGYNTMDITGFKNDMTDILHEFQDKE